VQVMESASRRREKPLKSPPGHDVIVLAVPFGAFTATGFKTPTGVEACTEQTSWKVHFINSSRFPSQGPQFGPQLTC